MTLHKRPVIIHRAILGSVERFMAILTENFGGAFFFPMKQTSSVPRGCSKVKCSFPCRQVAVLAEPASSPRGTGGLGSGRLRQEGARPTPRRRFHGAN